MTAAVNSKPHAQDSSSAFTDDQGSASGNALLGSTDPDGDHLSIASINGHAVGGAKGSTVFHGTYGDLTILPDGSYTYVAHDGLGLKLGTSVTESFQFKVSDGHGGVDAGVLKFTVNGTTNNAPVANDDHADATSGAATGNVLTNDTDADHDILRVSFVNDTTGHHYIAEGASYVAHGVYGDLTINADGSYSYTAGGAAYDALQGAAHDTFTYKNYDHTHADEGNSSDQGTLTIDVFHV